MIRRTTIEQHVGEHPTTGLRMTRLHEVITDVDGATESDAAEVDDLHAAEVELASLDAGPRAKATAWLEEHDVDMADEANWIRRAIAAVNARHGKEGR